MSPSTIYLDYNATTRLDPEVLAVMLPFLGEVYGNPSSVHHVGRQARALLDDARDRIAASWRSKPSEVIFTSGGTESCNLAILGTARHLQAKGRHIVTSQIEHHAVLHACEYLRQHDGFDITFLPVSRDGFVSVESVASAIRADTVLVSIMAANNETGAIQPVAEVGLLCRDRGVTFHTDAVQCFGKEPFTSIHQFNADLVSVCAHKFHGPKGAGALFIRSPLLPDPILLGGGHENERRAGTENLAGIIGFAEAFHRFVTPPVFSPSNLVSLAERLTACAQSMVPLGVTLRSPLSNKLTNTIAFTVAGCDSLSLLANLDLSGVCASSGSACSAGSLEPSHVMLALGVPPAEANSLIRLSLGRETTIEEVLFVERFLPEVISRVRCSS
jgi:cysteine desulfurase